METIEVAIIVAGSTLAGSFIGGLMSLLVMRYTKKEEWRQTQLLREINKREELYSEFAAECARLMMLAIDNKTSRASEFVKMGALKAKIRMTSTPEVIDAAEYLMSRALSSHLGGRQKEVPNEDYPEKLARFSEVCRQELEALKEPSFR